MGQGVDREFAKGQIRRMAMLLGFPREYPEAIGGLVEALMTAPSEEIAREAVSSYVDDADTETRCPLPKAIRTAVLDILTKREGDILPDPMCPKCKGIGQIIVEYPDGSSASKGLCSCHARRPPPDYRKMAMMAGSEPIGELLDDIAGAAKKLGGAR